MNEIEEFTGPGIMAEYLSSQLAEAQLEDLLNHDNSNVLAVRAVSTRKRTELTRALLLAIQDLPFTLRDIRFDSDSRVREIDIVLDEEPKEVPERRVYNEAWERVRKFMRENGRYFTEVKKFVNPDGTNVPGMRTAILSRTDY